MTDPQSPGRCLFIGGTLDGEWHTPARTTVKFPITWPVSVGGDLPGMCPYMEEIYSHAIMVDQDEGRIGLMIHSQLSDKTLCDSLLQRGFRWTTLFRTV